MMEDKSEFPSPQKENFSGESVGFPKAEIEKHTPELLLIFGQGPVIDQQSREKPATDAPGGHEYDDVNMWSQHLAEAGAILYREGQTKQIVVMGGPTGGEGHISEAEGIAKKLEALGVPREAIKREDRSSDTIANLINMVNMQDRGEIPATKFQTLGAEYHATRIKVLSNLLGIQTDPNRSFTAEGVLRWDARKSDLNSANWNTESLNTLGRSTDITNESFFSSQLGAEKRSYTDRAETDDVFVRELLDPKSWLGRVNEFESPETRRNVLNHAATIFPEITGEFGIKPETDSDAELFEKVSKVRKVDLGSEGIRRWKDEAKSVGWPPEVKERFTKIINEDTGKPQQ